MNPFADQNPDWYGEDREAYYALFLSKSEILYTPKNGQIKDIKLIAVGTWATKAAIALFKDLISK